MKKNIVITILAILVVGLGSFIVYDKIINKEKKDNKNIDNVETNKVAKKIDESKDYVYDAYRNDEYEVSKDAVEECTNSIISNKVGIAVPFINIDNDDAKKINEEMKVLYDAVNSDINNEDCTNQIFCGRYFLNYTTYYSGDIVSIIVSYGRFGTDTPRPTYLGYLFDLKSGKLLGIEDIANLNNISLNKLKEMSNNKIKEYMIDFGNKYDGEYAEYVDKAIQEFENSLSSIGQGKVILSSYDPFSNGHNNPNPKSGVIYFVDSNGKINLLTNIVIPAGIGKETRLFTLD